MEQKSESITNFLAAHNAIWEDKIKCKTNRLLTHSFQLYKIINGAFWHKTRNMFFVIVCSILSHTVVMYHLMSF